MDNPSGDAAPAPYQPIYPVRIVGDEPDRLQFIRIRRDILEDIDGPMLRHGLQEMDDQHLVVLPRACAAQPDTERLEERYEGFLQAG